MPARGRNEDGVRNHRGTANKGDAGATRVAGASLGVAPATGTVARAVLTIAPPGEP